MDLRLLEIFVQVCDAGSVTAAAERLHTTQPAVSQALARLEKELKLQLFERLSRRLYLSEAGKLFLPKARDLLERSQALQEEAGALSRQAPLRIGSCITIANRWLPAMVGKYGGAVRMEVASASAILDMLLQNRIDVALYEGAQPDDRCRAFRIGSYGLTPVCGRRHRLAGKTVTVDQLLGEQLLLREPGSAIREVLDSFLRLRQRRANPVMISVNSQAIIQAVQRGLGISVLPMAIVEQAIKEKQLAMFSVKSMHLENAVWILTHREKTHSAALGEFIAAAASVGLD